jgi:hypothetical protein
VGKLLEILSQHGPFALISGGLLYLFAMLWKRYQESYKEQLQVIVSHTAATNKLTSALEDVVASVQIQGEEFGRSAQDSRAMMERLLNKVEEHLEECKLEKAREEGRRSITNPHGVPIHRGEEP